MVPDFSSSQQVMNKTTGAVGTVYALVLSPIGIEDLDGISRLQVWTAIPGSDGTYGGWDFWLMDDCAPVAVDDTIEQGADLTVVTRDGYERSAIALASGYGEMAVMYEDGATEWIPLANVVIVHPTFSVVSIA